MMAGQFVKLDQDGTPVYVNTVGVAYISQGEKENLTSVFFSAPMWNSYTLIHIDVRGTVDEVAALLNGLEAHDESARPGMPTENIDTTKG